MARTSQDRRRRGTAPQPIIVSETATLLADDEAGLNGREAFANTALAAADQGAWRQNWPSGRTPRPRRKMRLSPTL
jgi:hypothetical protein